MALNFGILQPVNIGGQIMAGEQEAQRNQLAQQQLKTGAMQQEKAQMEMTGFKRRQAGLDVFLQESDANGKTGSPEAQTDSFYKFSLTQENPELIMAAQKLQQAAKERSAYQASRTPGAPAAPAIAPAQELPGVTVGGPNPPTVFGGAPMPTANRLTPAPAPAALVNRLGVDTNAMQTRIDELRSMYPNVPQAQKEADRLEKQLDRLNTTAPDAMLMQQLGYPLTQLGYQAFREAQRAERPDRLLTPAEEAQKTRIALASRPPAQPRAEQLPVAVIGPDGKPVLVAREQSFGMTPANMAEKPLTKAQEIKRRDTVGKEFKSATSALQTTQDVLDSIAFVKSEPGLSQATGFTGMLPSFPEGGAASADVRLANLKGKVTALGKAAAAASGNIGSIATVEWKILSDQIANIDPVKGTRPLLNQLDLIEQQAQGAMRRIQDGYERQFGEDFERFPQFSDLPAPKSAIKPKTPAPGNLSPAEQTELDRLRQRFGGKK